MPTDAPAQHTKSLSSHKKPSRLQQNNNQSPVKTPTSPPSALDKTVVISNIIQQNKSVLHNNSKNKKNLKYETFFDNLYQAATSTPKPQELLQTSKNTQPLSPVDNKKIEIINDKISAIRQEIEQDYPYPGYLSEGEGQAYTSLNQDIDNLEQLRSALERKVKIAPDDKILNNLNTQITDEAQKALNPASSPQVSQYKKLSIDPDGTYNY